MKAVIFAFGLLQIQATQKTLSPRLRVFMHLCEVSGNGFLILQTTNHTTHASTDRWMTWQVARGCFSCRLWRVKYNRCQ